MVSFCPGNREKGLPSIYGTVVLNDTKTGESLQYWMGNTYRNANRSITAAGIKHLSPLNSHSLGIIGTGDPGNSPGTFCLFSAKIDEIWAFDQDPCNLKHFAAEMNFKYPNVRVHLTNDSDQVTLNSQIIISATNSQNPVFKNSKELFTGRTFVEIVPINRLQEVPGAAIQADRSDFCGHNGR